MNWLLYPFPLLLITFNYWIPRRHVAQKLLRDAAVTDKDVLAVLLEDGRPASSERKNGRPREEGTSCQKVVFPDEKTCKANTKNNSFIFI